MARKDINVTEEKYIKVCNDLNEQIEIAYQAMKDLSDNLNVLMKGDSDGAYWNGASAKVFYNTAKENLNNDIYAYKAATEAWEKLEIGYINLLRKGYFK